MSRLNLTLDADTDSRLDRCARRLGRPRAALARSLLAAALDAQEAAERRRRLAADYAAGREDARGLLRDLEAGQVGLPE
jgi:predicted transcriptional regulator